MVTLMCGMCVCGMCGCVACVWVCGMCVCGCVWVCGHVHTCVPPGYQPVQQRTTIVLESLSISTAGNHDELEHLCPNVKELHLSSNIISDWLEVREGVREGVSGGSWLHTVTITDLQYSMHTEVCHLS